MDFMVADGRTSRVNLDDTGRYNGDRIFTCYINALELADTITATFHYDGKTVTRDYNAMQYIVDVRNHYQGVYSDELNALLDALQNYGHYLGLTNWSDGKSHTAIDSTDPPLSPDSIDAAIDGVKEKSIVKNVGESGIDATKVFFSLTLNAATVINLFIEKTDGLEITSAKIGTRDLALTEIQDSGKTYYQIKTMPIGAGALEKDYTITVTTSQDSQATFTVSAMSYVKAMLASGNEAEQYAMAAIYQYAETAKTFAQVTGK